MYFVSYCKLPITSKLLLAYLLGILTVKLAIVSVSTILPVLSKTLTPPVNVVLVGIVILITPVLLFKLALTSLTLLVIVPVNFGSCLGSLILIVYVSGFASVIVACVPF